MKLKAVHMPETDRQTAIQRGHQHQHQHQHHRQRQQ